MSKSPNIQQYPQSLIVLVLITAGLYSLIINAADTKGKLDTKGALMSLLMPSTRLNLSAHTDTALYT